MNEDEFYSEEYPPYMFSMRCENCHGSGRVRTRTMAPFRAAAHEIPIDATFTVSTNECDRCKGTGTRRVGPDELIDMVQSGHKVGKIQAAKPRLKDPSNFLYQIRSGDYALRQEDGRLFFEAACSLGAGDIRALKGFIPLNPTEVGL